MRLTSATGGTALPFAFGHAFREGDVPSGARIAAVGTAVTAQSADVRNRWPDGSVKFAVVCGTATMAAGAPTDVRLIATNDPAASAVVTLAQLKATGVIAEISFGGATSAWSGADWDTPHMTVQSSAAMSSWTFRKPLGTDAHLVGWLEVRCYVGGHVEVLPWIENGYLNVPGPSQKSGRAVFKLGGSIRYDSIQDANTPGAYSLPITVDASGVLTMPHHTRAVLVRNGTVSYWLTTDPRMAYAHDRVYLTNTKFVPAYHPRSINEASLAALTLTYNPGRLAYTTGAMGGTGYAPDIGLLPNTSALWLVSGDRRAYNAVIAGGFSLSNFCIHYRDETTNRPLRFSQHPTKSINSGTLLPTSTGPHSCLYASSHHPAAAYLPYLLTGWNWFIEEMQFQVTDHYLARAAGSRHNGNYYFYMSAGGASHNENSGIRAVAWQWRTTGMCTALTPDGDVLQNELKAVMNYNANKFRREYEVGDTDNPYGPNRFGALLRQHEISTSGFGLWHVGFMCASLGLVNDLKPISDATALSNFTWLHNFGMGIWGHVLGPTGDPTKYGFTRAANYAGLYLGEPTGSSFTWFTTMGEAWTRSWGSPNNAVSNTLVGGNVDGGAGFSTSYWGNMMPALAYAVENGAPGALEGYNRLIGATNWARNAAEWNDIPVWGVKPRNL